MPQNRQGLTGLRQGRQATMLYTAWPPSGDYIPSAGASRFARLVPSEDFWVAALVLPILTASAAADQLELAVWDAATDSKLYSTGVVTDVMNTLNITKKAVTGPGWIFAGRVYLVEAFHLTVTGSPAVACVNAHSATASKVNQMAGATLLTQEFGVGSPGAHTSMATLAGSTTTKLPVIGISNV